MANSPIVTARRRKTAVRPRPMKRSTRRDECAERGLFKKLGDPRSVLSWALSPSPNLLACIREQGVSRPASFRPVLPGWVAKGCSVFGYRSEAITAFALVPSSVAHTAAVKYVTSYRAVRG